MSWKTKAAKERATPKFVKRGTIVMVDGRIGPLEVMVKGRYGERNMWIIYTKEFGLVYVSSLQLMHIAEVLEAVPDNKGYEDFVSVEL